MTKKLDIVDCVYDHHIRTRSSAIAEGPLTRLHCVIEILLTAAEVYF